MVLFILFPGLGINKYNWEFTHDGKNLIKLDFIKKLKKIGKVYTFTPNIYKFSYYKKYSSKLQKLEDNFIEKPSKLKLEQFDIDEECKKVYEKNRSYKGKIIPIGHSAGGWYAYRFIQLYPEKCKKLILIESGKLISEYGVKQIKDKLRQRKVNKIPLKIEFDEKDSKKIIDYALLQYLEYVKKMNGKLNISTLLFENIKDMQSKYSDKLKNINKNLKIVYYKDTNHFPWENLCYSDDMIKQIKHFI